MTATRRHIIRRIHRETGTAVRQVMRNYRGATAMEIARRYLQAAGTAAPAA